MVIVIIELTKNISKFFMEVLPVLVIVVTSDFVTETNILNSEEFFCVIFPGHTLQTHQGKTYKISRWGGVASFIGVGWCFLYNFL